VAKKEGFLETDDATYLSRTILSKFKTLDYLRVVVGVDSLLKVARDRIEFLKRCQRIMDVVIKKARNIAHLGSFSAFRFDQRVYTLEGFLRDKLKLDEIGIEAAAIPFNVAGPEYILLSGNEIVVMGDEPRIARGEFQFVGGIGYVFDKKEGALSEERLFRSTVDLSSEGIDEGYIETSISRVTEDIQSNLHSLIFTDIWKKSDARPVGINFDGNILLKPAHGSEIWTGVFELYLSPP
ncbi:MAG: hypothetical protein RTU92_09785, partial [Candidatus Thorarchaeota archaeon]